MRKVLRFWPRLCHCCHVSQVVCVHLPTSWGSPARALVHCLCYTDC